MNAYWNMMSFKILEDLLIQFSLYFWDPDTMYMFVKGSKSGYRKEIEDYEVIPKLLFFLLSFHKSSLL